MSLNQSIFKCFLELLNFRNADKRITDCCLQQSGGGRCWAAQSCLTFCSPGLSHKAPLFSAISQSLLRFCASSLWCHPTISSPAIPFSALNLSQHQGLCQGVSSLHQVTKVLELQLHHQPFQWIVRADFL